VLAGDCGCALTPRVVNLCHHISPPFLSSPSPPPAPQVVAMETRARALGRPNELNFMYPTNQGVSTSVGAWRQQSGGGSGRTPGVGVAVASERAHGVVVNTVD
jgi:hypothetical protein